MNRILLSLSFLIGVLASSNQCGCEDNSSPSFHHIAPRKSAPAFKAIGVLNENFIDVNFPADYEGSWFILFFYPFDFTFVCPTEIVAFSDAASDFAALNTKIAGISTDSHHTHLAWIKTDRHDGGVGKLNIPLVADISKRISRNYGVLVEDENDGLYGAALRGTFIIDPKGIIRTIQINDESVGRNVEECMRLIKAFQHADSHGVGCPANWSPGSKDIKPDPVGSKEFFALWDN